MSLYTKRLEKGRVVWPAAKEGTVSLATSQLACLLEGIDWRNPRYTWRPQSTGEPADAGIPALQQKEGDDSLFSMDAVISPLPYDVEALKALLVSALRKADEADANLTNANAGRAPSRR